jgi:hypothetical protein
MTKPEFAEAIRILADSLPTSNLDKRVNALWEFYSETSLDIIKRAARECARKAKSFPSPGEFREWVEMFRPIETQKPYFAKPPIPENEIGIKIAQEKMDPRKMMLTILSQVDGREDKISEKPEIVRKMYRVIREMMGENLMNKIREEYKKNRENVFLATSRL